MPKQANAETITTLKDLHRGLHAAMDAFANNNQSELKVVLNQLDGRLAGLINELNKTSPGRWQ